MLNITLHRGRIGQDRTECHLLRTIAEGDGLTPAALAAEIRALKDRMTDSGTWWGGRANAVIIETRWPDPPPGWATGMTIEAVRDETESPRAAVYVAERELQDQAVCIGAGDTDAIEGDAEPYEYAGDPNAGDDTGLDDPGED